MPTFLVIGKPNDEQSNWTVAEPITVAQPEQAIQEAGMYSYDEAVAYELAVDDTGEVEAHHSDMLNL